MPFYVHAKDVDISKELESWEVPGTIWSFDHRGTAYQTAQSKIGTDGKPYTVTFVASEDEKRNWQRREKERFRSGEYLEVPWFGNARSACEFHYVHLSIKRPGMVAPADAGRRQL